MHSTADTLLLALFERQAHALLDCTHHRGSRITIADLARWVIDDAARHIGRVQRNREQLRTRLQERLAAWMRSAPLGYECQDA